jgi:MFS transporter, BCD family, chlorophyll transporter
VNPFSRQSIIALIKRVSPHYLPFADAASIDLPLSRLLRLSLFQVSVGMATALIVGTLNRVMIVELHVAAWLVALMVALPLVSAPFRALIGFKSDSHCSVLGWRRVPFLFIGTMMLFSGLAIMPFALILLTGQTATQLWIGHIAAALAFLITGIGLQTSQTAGLALATDLAPEPSRPRVVALMYVMLLIGMLASSALFGLLLQDFSFTRLIQVVQGAAVVALLMNVIALWKQEPRNFAHASHFDMPADFRAAWLRFRTNSKAVRFMTAIGLGTLAFNMQDIILEPYGGEILGLSVGQTTLLTALMAAGALGAFALAAIYLKRGMDPYRLAAVGVLVGVVAFSAVIFAEPLNSPMLFRAGAVLIGIGGGLFSVSTLTAAMGLETDGLNGLALGAWGAAQATCAGIAIFLGGSIRDAITSISLEGYLGTALANPATGYSVVYHIEIYFMFATLIALGPLASAKKKSDLSSKSEFGLAEFPG